MRILLVGAGYVGLSVVKYLKKKGHHLTVATTDPKKKERLLTSSDAVVDAHHITGAFDVVIITVAPKNGSSYEETYLQTAKNLQRKELSFEHIIYTSSTGVYGNHQGNWVYEHSELLGNAVLIETEKILLSYQVPVTIFRLGGIFGPQREIQRDREGPIFGAGDSFLNLIHLQDIVQAIDWALTNQCFGVYNLTNDCHLMRKDFYKKSIFSASHGDSKRVSNQKIKREGYSFVYPECPT